MAEALLEQLPPQSVEAEQSTLGAMIIDREATAVGLEMLQPEDFYREAHRKIFEAIRELFERNEPIDLITLQEELERRGELDDVGGAAYLATLMGSVPTAAHIQRYATIVSEKALLRNLIAASRDIQRWAYEGTEPATEIADRCEQRLFEVTERRVTRGFTGIGPVVKEVFDRIDARYHDERRVVGIPSGLIDLDTLTCGFQKSDMIVIAGRPSMGKSALILNIARHVATHPTDPKTVALFSLEMSKEQVVDRMLAAEARINSYALRTGRLPKHAWDSLGAALNTLFVAPIYIDDSPTTTPLEMRSKCRRLKAERGLDIVLIDHLQLIHMPGKFDNRHQEIGAITRSLKAMARELEVPVVVCSQLARRVEEREDRRPILSDLMESGSIEADADLVIFIYRQSYYRYQKNVDPERIPGEAPPEDEAADETAELIVAKHRHGPTGTVEVAFLREFQRFENLEKRAQEM